MAPPILTTKLYIPPPRAELVPRPRLTQRLDESLARTPSISLISAPPGFGKTTLLSEWIYQKNAGEQGSRGAGAGLSPASPLPRSPAVSWVSLDEQDNDPVRFWNYVIAALEKIQPGVGVNALTLLHAPQTSPIEETLIALINAAVTIPQPFTLVLDDYHLIEREAIHQAFAFFLDHLPPQMHLILISRTVPPVPLTRFRVRHQLTELRDNDLRFTPTEAATFLNQVMGLELTPTDIIALERRTEGWIAGLQLAALSMQGRRDVQGFVEAFTGSHRYVLDYLAEEVLSRQPEPIRQFLLSTSILERLHGPLCDAVLSGGAEGQGHRGERVNSPPPPAPLPLDSSASGQEILERLEQAHLFIIPLDDERRWYRYHHLFADFLREYLRRTASPEEIARLHHQASVWYAANGYEAEAINHALAANDLEASVRLIEGATMSLLIQAEAVTLMDWLDKLPEALILARPRLSLGQAWAHLILNNVAAIEPVLAKTEQRLSELQPGASPDAHSEAQIQSWWGEVAALRSMILVNSGQVEAAISLAEHALTHLPPDELIGRSILFANLGEGYAMRGEFTQAVEALTESVRLSAQSDNLVILFTSSNSLAEIQLNQGNLAQAAAIYEQARDFIDDHNQQKGQAGQPSPLAGRAYLGLAEIARQQNDLENAIRYVNTGIELSARQGHVMGAETISQIILATILQAQGDSVGAQEAIEEALASLGERSPVTHWTAAVQARLWLAQGNLSAAMQWARSCDLPLDDEFSYREYPGEYASLVRVYLANEQFEEALDLLDRLAAAEQKLSRKGRLLEIFLLRALTLHASGDTAAALPWLKQALPIAAAGGYVRLFLDEGPVMAGLLRKALASGVQPHEAYVEQLLDAFAAEPSQATALSAQGFASAQLIEPLSERELEVLQLIADGLSNQEIADRLIIAEGTVKKHIHNIFGKLDVRRRTQVVLRARELGLL